MSLNLADVAASTAAAGLVEKVRPLLAGTSAWAVGGAIRDAALGREVRDLDLAVAGDPEAAARKIADGLDGSAFELSAEFTTWRVVSRDRDWQVDVASLRGSDIAADLGERDFTIGAIAVELETGEGLDPFNGLADLEAGLIRAVGRSSFSADPLRLMRAARLVSTGGWLIEEETLALARASAPRSGDPAGERTFDELCQLLDGADPVAGVHAMDSIGLFETLFPEVGALKGVVQGPNHHLDVYGHTIEVLEGVVAIESDLGRYTGESAAAVADLLSESLGGRATRSTGLRLAGLFHDIAKPVTRKETEGCISFRGHDKVGVEMIDRMFSRLKAGRRVTRFVADLTRHHLILGFMVPERPLSRRQEWFYLDRSDPVAVEVTLLTVADRLAARGDAAIAGSDMIEGHLALASEMVAAGIKWRRDGRPRPFLAGDELAREVGIEPGPGLGEVIKELEAARYAGEIESASDAVKRARQFLGRR